VIVFRKELELTKSRIRGKQYVNAVASEVSGKISRFS
jgi:hypothetical protein